ncbi:MAG: NFACT family protein [Candidatus Diapherotrites archaeon]|nr:NFACT family protein [Candidatus Diapherotrites archaeon]
MQKHHSGMQEKAKHTFELPNLTLSLQLRELEPFVRGSVIEKAQDLEKGWLKLRLKTAAGSKDLVFSPNAFFMAEYRADAKQQSSGFGAFLKKSLAGKRIIALKQMEAERIVSFEFEDFSLVARQAGA